MTSGPVTAYRRVFFDRYELDAHMADNRVEAWAS